jgi:S1-C subfamily serine protease
MVPALLIAVLGAAPAAAQEAEGDPTAAAAVEAGEAPAEPDGLGLLLAFEDVLADVIARCEPSVVAIARVRPRDDAIPAPADFFNGSRATSPPDDPSNPDFIPQEFGTGVVIDADGLILTNRHVLGEDREGYEFYVTTFDRQPHKATVLAADPRTDLAVLKIEASGLTPIALGDASKLRKGQIVITLGNPYAIARDGQASAGWGIVSNLERKAGPELGEEIDRKPTLHHYGTLIQTDARLNLGTSGGPLLNLRGEMIGLVTSLAALAGYEQAAGYAIPVNDVFLRAIEELKHGREVEFGFLGVQPDNRLPEEVLGGLHGARLLGVVGGSPAERARLVEEDVVLAVEGEPVHTVDDLMLEIARRPVESTVRLTVHRRDGTTRSVNVTLAKCPRGRREAPIVTSPRPMWRGLRVDHASVYMNDETWWPTNVEALRAGCVAVADVEQDSPAWNEGIRALDVITHVGRTRVESPDEFYAAVADAPGPVTLRMGYGEFAGVLGQERLRTVPPDAPQAEDDVPPPADEDSGA